MTPIPGCPSRSGSSPCHPHVAATLTVPHRGRRACPPPCRWQGDTGAKALPKCRSLTQHLKSVLPTSSPPYLTAITLKGRAGEDTGVKSQNYNSSPETHCDDCALHPTSLNKWSLFFFKKKASGKKNMINSDLGQCPLNRHQNGRITEIPKSKLR